MSYWTQEFLVFKSGKSLISCILRLWDAEWNYGQEMCIGRAVDRLGCCFWHFPTQAQCQKCAPINLKS